MKKMLGAFLAVLGLAAMMSCATTLPVAATGNPIGSKTGVASELWILGLPPFASGAQGGIVNAAKNGKISKVSTVEIQVQTYFIFSNIKTIVTGE
jgi:hypothetical protein